MKKLFGIAIITTVIMFGSLGVFDNIFAHPHNNITVSAINEKYSLEETVTILDIPKDNTFPWATVSGEASKHVTDYPIIIQIYQDKDAKHFAQIDGNEDGSYEYKLRIRNLDYNTGEFTNIYEGQYIVKIFKIIPNTIKSI